MTRFARAKGSKASNEKTPEDSTPWVVMKEQLLNAQKKDKEEKFKEEAERKRLENYENFLKDQRVQKRKSTWCEFDNSEYKTLKSNQDSKHEKKVAKRKKKKQNIAEKSNVNENKNQSEEHSITNKKNNELTSKEKPNNDFISIINNEIISESEIKDKQRKRSFDKSKDLSEVIDEKDAEIREKKKKKHKKKADPSNGSKKNIDTENTCSETITSIQKEEGNYHENDLTSEFIENKNIKKTKRNKNKEKALKDDTKKDDTNSTSNNNSHSESSNNINVTKTKNNNRVRNNKIVNGTTVRRKPMNDRSFQLIINGKEIELLRFDGFPVMKKDAERLEELKKNMIKKGIPKSEVQRTMKLERRRAEKALARLKREVCYNCRKGGHNLSDCPDLKSKIPGKDSAEGICFKCGSTEHRQFECKVQKDKEFRFATCFICKEPGHIARQCPDNPKGLYPNGGCCKLCKDVTHLRKDCPTIMGKKEESSSKLLSLDTTDNIEDIGPTFKNNTVQHEPKKPKKIKF